MVAMFHHYPSYRAHSLLQTFRLNMLALPQRGCRRPASQLSGKTKCAARSTYLPHSTDWCGPGVVVRPLALAEPDLRLRKAAGTGSASRVPPSWWAFARVIRTRRQSVSSRGRRHMMRSPESMALSPKPRKHLPSLRSPAKECQVTSSWVRHDTCPRQ
ncbi:hypothetical protein LY76DRAFT_418362 [Colletotrichum caudatum]|nr:hypothetical protein LY76DRAFT_418362 [Colletotrichum caudatum]